MDWITTWNGVSIEKLSREELIEVLNCCASELMRTRTPEAIRARALGAVEILKRGEAG